MIGSDWDKDPKETEGRPRYRGYYTAARRYEIYFRTAKTILGKSDFSIVVFTLGTPIE